MQSFQFITQNVSDLFALVYEVHRASCIISLICNLNAFTLHFQQVTISNCVQKNRKVATFTFYSIHWSIAASIFFFFNFDILVCITTLSNMLTFGQTIDRVKIAGECIIIILNYSSDSTCTNVNQNRQNKETSKSESVRDEPKSKVWFDSRALEIVDLTHKQGDRAKQVSNDRRSSGQP